MVLVQWCSVVWCGAVVLCLISVTAGLMYNFHSMHAVSVF